MDRALIERMVGAVALVLLLVVVAPALLDGSRESDRVQNGHDTDGAVRTEVILLNGRSGERETGLPAVEDRPVEIAAVPPGRPVEPVAAAVSAPVPEPSTAPEPSPEPAPAPAPAKTAPAAITSEPPRSASQQLEGYAVQIGSFSRKDNADQFAAELSSEGYAVFVMPAKTAGGTVYRVNAGPRPTRAAAEKLAAEIGKGGRRVMVIEIDSGGSGGSQ